MGKDGADGLTDAGGKHPKGAWGWGSAVPQDSRVFTSQQLIVFILNSKKFKSKPFNLRVNIKVRSLSVHVGL